MTDYPYLWRCKSYLPARKGQPCRVVEWLGTNLAMVEFEDGQQYRAQRAHFYARGWLGS